MRSQETPPEAWPALAANCTAAREGLLDTRKALMNSMQVADEFQLSSLHMDITERVTVIDDLLLFVTPQKIEMSS